MKSRTADYVDRCNLSTERSNEKKKKLVNERQTFVLVSKLSEKKL